MEQLEGNNSSKITEIGNKNNEEQRINLGDQHERSSNLEAQSIARSISTKNKLHCVLQVAQKESLLKRERWPKRAQIKLGTMKREIEFKTKEVATA